MPNGDNWQNDVLRDLRNTAPRRGPQEETAAPRPAGPEGQQPPAPGPAAPAYGYPHPNPNPNPHPNPQTEAAQAPAPAYGYPHTQPPAGPQDQAAPYPAQPQAPFPGEAQAPAPFPAQAQAQPQAPQPYQHPQAQPQQPYQPQQPAAPQQSAAPHQPAAARPAAAQYPGSPQRGATPDSRPVVDKRLAATGGKPRRGEPFAARALRAVRRTVSSSAAREVAETTAVAEVLQQAVTTGRQIAVTSIRGGSGKTTVAALLSTTYAHYRQDPVLVVEADPALGSLPLRLGAESLRWTTGDLAGLVEPQMSLLDVTGYLVQLPDNAWLLPGSQGQVGAMLDTRGYERVMVSLRRYFGVTVVDCETLPAEVARTALSAAQARVLTVPATLEGLASTHAVLEWMRGLPRSVTTSTVVLLTETVPHTGLDLDKAAGQLKETGASVRVLPYDRHLAAGGAIRTDLLARATRQAATELAAEVFRLSQTRR
ncbi:MinD/ParA family ATP-binding protein [Streptomyces sp. NPDC003703]|uniref:MinD/ParA family ATP-binding protein n=1 Tax=Streptomyces sp. NPDC003283 TaxID=3364681 RepID=UPI0036A90285